MQSPCHGCKDYGILTFGNFSHVREIDPAPDLTIDAVLVVAERQLAAPLHASVGESMSYRNGIILISSKFPNEERVVA